MPREFVLLDVLVPTLLLVFIGSVVLQALVDKLCKQFDFLSICLASPPCFRFSVFVGLFCTLGLVVMQ